MAMKKSGTGMKNGSKSTTKSKGTGMKPGKK